MSVIDDLSQEAVVTLFPQLIRPGSTPHRLLKAMLPWSHTITGAAGLAERQTLEKDDLGNDGDNGGWYDVWDGTHFGHVDPLISLTIKWYNYRTGIALPGKLLEETMGMTAQGLDMMDSMPMDIGPDQVNRIFRYMQVRFKNRFRTHTRKFADALRLASTGSPKMPSLRDLFSYNASTGASNGWNGVTESALGTFADFADNDPWDSSANGGIPPGGATQRSNSGSPYVNAPIVWDNAQTSRAVDFDLFIEPIEYAKRFVTKEGSLIAPVALNLWPSLRQTYDAQIQLQPMYDQLRIGVGSFVFEDVHFFPTSDWTYIVDSANYSEPDNIPIINLEYTYPEFWASNDAAQIGGQMSEVDDPDPHQGMPNMQWPVWFSKLHLSQSHASAVVGDMHSKVRLKCGFPAANHLVCDLTR